MELQKIRVCSSLPILITLQRYAIFSSKGQFMSFIVNYSGTRLFSFLVVSMITILFLNFNFATMSYILGSISSSLFFFFSCFIFCFRCLFVIMREVMEDKRIVAETMKVFIFLFLSTTSSITFWSYTVSYNFIVFMYSIFSFTILTGTSSQSVSSPFCSIPSN